MTGLTTPVWIEMLAGMSLGWFCLGKLVLASCPDPSELAGIGKPTLGLVVPGASISLGYGGGKQPGHFPPIE